MNSFDAVVCVALLVAIVTGFKTGLLRSVLFMWYLRTLYKFGVSPAQLQRMYIDVR